MITIDKFPAIYNQFIIAGTSVTILVKTQQQR